MTIQFIIPFGSMFTAHSLLTQKCIFHQDSGIIKKPPGYLVLLMMLLLKLESLIRLCLIIIINDIFPVEVVLAPKIAV